MNQVATPFVYMSAPSRVIFGAGSTNDLCREIGQLSIQRVLFVGTSSQRDRNLSIARSLEDQYSICFNEAEMHTPVHITEKAMAIVESQKIDGIIAVGGGSSVGLSKAIAYRTGLPQIIIPTTYSGSEVTAILTETEGGHKLTRTDPYIRPNVVIYDVNQTLSLPAHISVTSGMNAIAHAVEALYAHDTNPVIASLAEQGIQSLIHALPMIVESPYDVEAREKALYGAWLCGICLGSTSMAIHHKLCHTLGGTFELPHAETHTALLPHAVSFNLASAPNAAQILSRVFDNNNPARALFDLAKHLGAQMSLKGLGMPEDGIDRATELSFKKVYPNPRPLDHAGVRELIRNAWEGKPPA
ncbi:maleylacetate reductase [Pseudomonas sp. Z1-14]|uniref:maleylacetate reductase n=1 Tax=Pseudomonas sp. Z1-14 TaxID=2817409 RepID=UPI003DA9D0BB